LIVLIFNIKYKRRIESMTTQEMLNNLLNDPEVKELLTRLNNENLNAVQSNNGLNSAFFPENDNRCCPRPCPPPCPPPKNFDFGIVIVLLLLFCCCGCGGAFLCC
jgi:hypothetical protein